MEIKCKKCWWTVIIRESIATKYEILSKESFESWYESDEDFWEWECKKCHTIYHNQKEVNEYIN